MPIYEYECEDCSKVFETFVKVNDPPEKKCPCCEGTRVKKLISNCSFQLKGTGWYATDYAKKGPNSSNDNSNTKKTSQPDKTEQSSAKPEASTKPEKSCSGKAA